MKTFLLRPSASTLNMLRQACLQRRDAVPPTLTEKALIPGIPNARYWLDHDLTPFIRDVSLANLREAEALANAGLPNDTLPLASMLAVSGGRRCRHLRGGHHCGMDPAWVSTGVQSCHRH